MTYIPNVVGTVDSNNSSTSVLTANTVFSGTATIVTSYNSIIISSFSNVASANTASTGLAVQFSTDASTWYTYEVYNTQANLEFNVTIAPQSKYFRIIYTNGASPQGSFQLQTILSAVSSQITSVPNPSTYRASAIISVAVPGINFAIAGSASRTVLISRVGFTYATTGTAGVTDITLKLLSAVSLTNSSTVSAIPTDQNFSAAAATVYTWSTAPVSPTVIGIIYSQRALIASSNANSNYVADYVVDFGSSKATPIILRGTGNILAFNMLSVIATTTIGFWIEWIEY